MTKDKAEHDFIDEKFDVSQSESYHLSMQISQTSFSFCVFNTAINKYVLLRSYNLPVDEHQAITDKCKSIFDKDDLLRKRYKSSYCSYTSPRYTFVPQDLFDDSEADLYLTFNHGDASTEKTLQNHVKSANLFNVFSYPEPLADLLKSQQHNIKLFHHASSLINGELYSLAGKSGIAVLFHTGYLDIVIIKNNKLSFYNSFPVFAPEDVVYYLTLVANLFEIPLKSTRLSCAGSLNDFPAETTILKDFVSELVECTPPETVTYSHRISDSLRKQFVNLFYLYECE